ncbi:MAG: biopolymer transporter ExbD [Polyangiaceae bacterium]|nr:biopolymer transporter ExbD [Polyangiaceae bacterium]
MARASSDSDEMIAGINVTPLVDVTLVLLIIMMVTAKIVLSQGLKMELPAGGPSGGPPVELLSVKITGEQTLLLNNESIPNVDVLAQRARDAKRGNPDVKAVIGGDPKAKHGLVIKVLDALKRNGIDKIAFTKPKEATAAGAPAPAPAPGK